MARRDPKTGEKINKLRKSYENKVKALELEGRNKAEANSNELQGLLDPLWDSLVEGNLTMWNAKWAAENDLKNLENRAAHNELAARPQTPPTGVGCIARPSEGPSYASSTEVTAGSDGPGPAPSSQGPWTDEYLACNLDAWGGWLSIAR